MKTIIIFLMILFYFTSIQGQISLEHIYSNAATYSSYNNQLFLVKFAINGERYVKIDKMNRLISFYDLNHSFISSISLASLPDVSNGNSSNNFTLIYLSDNLFNLDNKIEFMYISNYVGYTGDSCFTGIYNEDLTPILTCYNEAPWIQPNYHQQQYPIYNTANGTKLIMSTKNNQAKVYSLQGQLTSVDNGNNFLINDYMINMTVFPNPSRQYSEIKFQLPIGIDEGEINIYDSEGKRVKTYIVNKEMEKLVVDISDLSNGIYYYSLQTVDGITSKKILKMK